MSLIVSHPALLPFLLAIGLPLVLHLFARAKPPEYPVASTWLLRRIVRETQQAKKPRDWLLLVLRTLLVAAIVGVFLQPKLFLGQRLAARGKARNIVVIIDRSASMSVLDGANTRFASARAEAATILSDLDGSDRVNLIWLGARPQPEFPTLGYNADYLSDMLRRAEVSHEVGNPRAALQMAAEMFGDAAGAKEIYLISDFQRSNYEGLSVSLPDDISLVTINVAQSGMSNQALGRIGVYPNPALVGETMRVECDLSNFGPEPAMATVFLAAGEHRARRETQVPAGGQVTVLFELLQPRAGSEPATITLNAEDFSVDNQRHSILHVEQALRLAVVGETAEAQAWLRAAGALDWCEARQRSWEDLAAGVDADVIFAAGWSGQHSRALQAHLARGGGLILHPAAGLSSDALATVAGPQTASRSYQLDSNRELQAISIGEPDDPVLRVFDGGQYGDPTGKGVHARLLLPAALGTPILRYSDGVAALARVQPEPGHAGKLIIWNIPLQGDDAAWAQRQEFLPLVGEIILDLRPSQADRFEHAPGDRIRLPMPGRELAGSVQLLGPDGENLTVNELVDGGNIWLESEPLREPGVYEWQGADRTLSRIVCNVSPRESNLASLNPNELVGIGTHQAADGRAITHLRSGITLWPWLLAAALLLMMAELVVTHWSEQS